VQQAAEDAADARQEIHTPGHVANLARRLLWDEGQEVFLVFMLNIRHAVIGYMEVGRGGLDQCPVDPRLVYRAAIQEGAAAVVVAHNHPSGICQPSPLDDVMTARLKNIGEVLGIQLMDHVIVGDGKTYSYLEHNKL
jgi:DNA repair protein RadC